MAAKRRTKGRRSPWACGHRGFGAECHRCAQANDLETKANELAQNIKTKAKTLPVFVVIQKAEKATETTPALEAGVLIKAGGQRVFVPITNRTQEAAITQAATVMREHATRLHARPEDRKAIQ